MEAKPSCQIICKVLASQGIRDAIISPGSRNTPLIQALDNIGTINKNVAIDERSAAFIALGMAQVSKRPVILCCTSGTALLNYAPAVAEAYYQGIPLIILSADRPAEWIDQDDSQTLRQFEALRNYVKASYDIPDFAEDADNMVWFANRTANEAYMTTIKNRPGPVHINMQFAEPLTGKHSNIAPQRLITTADTASCLPPQLMKELAKEASGKRVLIVAGQYPPSNRINRAIAVLSHLPNVVVWAESIANIHTPGIVSCIDRTLVAIPEGEEATYRPELVISFGGALVSRKAKAFLRNCTGCGHWSIGYRTNRLADPFMQLTKVIETLPEVFLPHFANALCRCHPEGNYSQLWEAVTITASNRHSAKMANTPWSSLRAFATIMQHIPPKVNLQLSNGTAIRYAQLFESRHIHASYCNRGVSGIDGSTSTAIGAAAMYNHPTLLISGDMSFAYDIGALAAQCITPELKIIVINNAGGEIFRFISTTRSLHLRERYFSVPPLLPLRKLADAYGFTYYEASSERSLKGCLQTLFTPTLKPVIVEIIVDAEISARALSDYFKNN